MTLFEHARDHLSHYQALAVGRGSAVAFATIRESLSYLVRRELAATDDEGSAHAVPREVAVQFVVGAYMAVLAWWLDGGAKLPPKAIDTMFRSLLTGGVAAPVNLGRPVPDHHP